VNPPAALLAGALSLALVAGSTAVTAAADAATTRPAQAVHVSRTHHVVAPATLRPGLVDLRNTGGASVYVVRKTSWGVKTFVADYNSPSGAGFQRHFITRVHLYGHRDAYLKLTRGTYYLVDGTRSQISAGLVKTVTVRGTYWNAPAPASRLVTISGRGSKLTAPSTLPTRRYLHVLNRTGKTQWVELFRVGSRTSASALAAFVANPTMRKLGRLDLRSVQYPFLGSAHQSLYYGFRASAGRYLMITLGFTPTSNRPQFGKGQAVAIRVG
jgi:hypothetical protein